jgi:DNA polymerase/3'-5' exonuclease PolX
MSDMWVREKYPAQDTKEFVYKIFCAISPYTSKFKLVGSLGRKEDQVGDIDILVEPTDIPAIRAELSKMGTWKRGGDRLMVINNVFDSVFQFDLWLSHPPSQWGVAVAIRLNPAPLVIYGKKVIDSKGLTRGGGTIFNGDQELSIPEEEDWFKLVDLPYVEVTERWKLVEELGLEDSRERSFLDD